MGYRILADLVVLAHLGFIVFVSLGGLLACRWRWILWLHLPALAWGIIIELSGGICPLTPLENALRRAGGLADYPEGFIDRHVIPVVYPMGLTREDQLVVAVALVLLNILIYACVIRRYRRQRPR